jgi:hypothetical protein
VQPLLATRGMLVKPGSYMQLLFEALLPPAKWHSGMGTRCLALTANADNLFELP